MEIQGYPNYLIFKNGSVLSKGNPECAYHNRRRPRFLKHQKGTRYLHVRLINDKGKGVTKNLHRLLALHYIPNPYNKKTVDHKNQNRHDNRLCNLRWATSKEQRANQGVYSLRKDNPSGHKCIGRRNDYDAWDFCKTIKGKRFRKCFTLKKDALCYKYIIQLRIKARHFH